MTLYRATSNGNIAMTLAEESQFLAEQAINESLPNKKLMLRASINEQKKKRESAGVNVAGVTYSIDFSARFELCNAYVQLVKNPDITVTVESKSGDVVELDKAGLEVVFDAVNGRVSAITSAKKQHFENIRLLTKDNVSTYDINTLWP